MNEAAGNVRGSSHGWAFDRPAGRNGRVRLTQAPSTRLRMFPSGSLNQAVFIPSPR
jgi:hypothetical protein